MTFYSAATKLLKSFPDGSEFTNYDMDVMLAVLAVMLRVITVSFFLVIYHHIPFPLSLSSHCLYKKDYQLHAS